MAFLTGLLTVVIIGVSSNALYQSGQSIPKLQKYEGKAQKAAEWSNVAEKRLQDTRKTVAAGFVTVRPLHSVTNVEMMRHGRLAQQCEMARNIGGTR